MGLSNIQRLKVILLLSGYLFVVLTHLQFLKSPEPAIAVDAGAITKLKPFVDSKAKQAILHVKKIDRTVLTRPDNRDFSAGLHLKFVKLFFNRNTHPATGIRLAGNFTTAVTLPVKRCLYLRI